MSHQHAKLDHPAGMLSAYVGFQPAIFRSPECMPSPIVINSSNGSLKLLDLGLVIRKGMERASVEAMLSQFPKSVVDHGNGYSWSSFNGLTFGSMPCGISLCFHHGALTEVHLGVVLPNRKFEHEWPTREASDQEIAFVRKVFHDQLKRRFRNKVEHFPWGVAWSMFDEKGFCASSGIRYA